jgi:hypothetical protein
MSKVDELTNLAGAIAIWEMMEQTAIATATPGDGRAEGYRKAAADFQRLFDKRAAELHATPKQIAVAMTHKANFKKFAKKREAAMALDN